MSAINEIVDISITRDTLGVRRAGFSVPIIIGEGLATGDRVSFFTNRDDVAAAVFGGVDSVEYKMADVVFSQNPSVERLAIGGQNEDKAVEFTGTMTAGNIVATVNGTVVTEAFDTDLNTTIGNLATSITGEAISGVDTATALTNVLTVTADAGAFVGITIGFTSLGSGDTVTASLQAGSETVLEAFQAIRLVNDSWYWVLIASRTEQDQKDIALEVEGLKKHFCTASSDANIVNQAAGTDTTSLAYFFENAGYVRTSLFYIGDNTAQFPDAGYVGRLAPLDPGSYTGKFKTLIKVIQDDLISTQSLNARDKNCNTYEEVGQKNITREGITPSGEFTDVIVFIDWLESTMADDVYAGLTSDLKTPFTDPGIQSVGSTMEPSLKTGQNRGGISPLSFDDDDVQDGGYQITVPRRQDLDPNDIALRILRDLSFTAWLSGAIHFVKIRGTVTV
jgi:hypothetical protein